jgi:hypothetical protein
MLSADNLDDMVDLLLNDENLSHVCSNFQSLSL